MKKWLVKTINSNHPKELENLLNKLSEERYIIYKIIEETYIYVIIAHREE